MLEIILSNRFKKDLKLAKKRGCDRRKLFADRETLCAIIQPSAKQKTKQNQEKI